MAFVAGTQVRSSRTQAVANAAATVKVKATVETRTLTVDTAETFGTVTVGQRVAVLPTIEGPQVVTAQLVSPGDQVTSGQAVTEVSGRPIIALDLPFALYRDLVPGSEGRDVQAVQTALQDLGLYQGRIDGIYGDGTAQAVAALYRRVSMPPPSAPGEAVDGLADAQSSLAAAQEHLAAVEQDAADASTVQEARTAVAAAQTALTRAQTKALTPLPRSEVVRIPVGGAQVVTVAPTGSDLGGDQNSQADPESDGAHSDGAAVTLVSGAPLVTTRVGVSRAPLFVQNATVTAIAVSDVALTAQGTVTVVSEFRTSPSDDGGPPGYDVTIALTLAGKTDGFGDGSRVRLEPAGAAPTIKGPAVPLTALRTEAGATYVLVVTETGSRRVDVEVVGSADGYAVVAGVSDGDEVVVGS